MISHRQREATVIDFNMYVLQLPDSRYLLPLLYQKLLQTKTHTPDLERKKLK